MKLLTVAGVALIALGVIGFIYGVKSYTSSENIVDM
jgi:preprotein translocase subunit Sss1